VWSEEEVGVEEVIPGELHPWQLRLAGSVPGRNGGEQGGQEVIDARVLEA
jgi:hypothetical protein